MSTVRIFVLVLVLLGVVCSLSVAGTRRPGETWSYYHFDGSSFQPGPSTDGAPTVALKQRVRPQVLSGTAATAEALALPDNSGVIAGICYYQTSGGKLTSGGSGYAPCQQAALLVSAEGKPFVTVQTDANGYFVAVLPVGRYRIGSEIVTDEIPVDIGITTLVPLRAGKRMVD